MVAVVFLHALSTHLSMHVWHAHIACNSRCSLTNTKPCHFMVSTDATPHLSSCRHTTTALL